MKPTNDLSNLTRHHVAAAFKRLVIICGYAAHRNDTDMKNLVRLAHGQLRRMNLKPRELVEVLASWPRHQPVRSGSSLVYAGMLAEMVGSYRTLQRSKPTPKAQQQAVEASTINFFFQLYLEQGSIYPYQPLAWLADALGLKCDHYLELAHKQIIRENSEHKRELKDKGRDSENQRNNEARIYGRSQRLAVLAYFAKLKEEGVVKIL